MAAVVVAEEHDEVVDKLEIDEGEDEDGGDEKLVDEDADDEENPNVWSNSKFETSLSIVVKLSPVFLALATYPRNWADSRDTTGLKTILVYF